MKKESKAKILIEDSNTSLIVEYNPTKLIGLGFLGGFLLSFSIYLVLTLP